MDGNLLYYGDNLDVLRRHIKDESIDLVYLDPPFNSQANYNVLFVEHGERSAAQINAFEDTWQWDEAAAYDYQQTVEQGGTVADALRAFRTMLGTADMLAYLSMMAPRLVELRRVLKSDGSIYLHCDSTASAYLKVLLDAIFGPLAFRNEIIWKRTSGHSDAHRYGRSHDVILFYGKGAHDVIWNDPVQAYDPQYVEQYYRYVDPDGRRFMSADLGAAGLSGGGYDYEWRGVRRVWRCPENTMRRYQHDGRIFYTKNGIPRLKRYLDEAKGLPAQDVWVDIEALRSWHKERLGYPTQKPEALLERIILASTSDGATVLDPFCGCGTAVAVAQRLNRRWVGIDITHLAIGLIKHRLADAYGPSVSSTYQVIGEPTDVDGARELASSDPFQFQAWALGLVGARIASSAKKGGDKGIDGRLYFHDGGPTGSTKQILFSVKAGHLVPTYLRDLRGTIDREEAQIGVLLTFETPSAGMRAEAASAGFYSSPWGGSYPRLQLLTVGQLLEGKQIEYPHLTGGNVTHRRAPRELKVADQGELGYGDSTPSN